MTSDFMRWMALGLLACGVQGCGSATPDWDGRFGTATRANLAAQAIDPAPATSRDPTLGLDGRAARAAIEHYQRTFASPETGQPAALVGQ